MVHETKLLTFWRTLNQELAYRGAKPVTLDIAEIFHASGVWEPAEVADVLATPSRLCAPRDWSQGFNDIFREN